MTMKKATVLGLVILAALVPAAVAGLTPTQLPSGYMAGWEGKATYAENLGGGQILHGHIEFAVYDTQAAGNGDIFVPGNRRYLYAYQVFNNGSQATAALSYFGLTGIKAGAITSSTDIDTKDADGGVDATRAYFNLSKTAASFEFDNGILAVDGKSFFLLIGSNSTPVVGGYSVIAPEDDGEITTPGGDDNTGEQPIPEPATMAILLGGTLLSLRKRK